MLHLRLIVAVDLVPVVVAGLESAPAVAHVAVFPGASRAPAGDVLLCDIAREGANEVVEWLQALGVHRSGAIIVDRPDTVISDAAASADAAVPGYGSDALVWEELEARARAEAEPTPSFAVFMAIAAVIAAIGILLDSPVLIVGAMVVGPEYGPLAAVCVALARRRPGAAARAAATLLFGLVVAAGVTVVAGSLFRVTDVAPSGYELSDRQLTAFISHPDALAAVVALLAGIAGMLSLTQGRSGVLVGVLVSVTTIPAVANVGLATAYGEWREVAGAATQLAVNLAGLALAGVATLAVQARATGART